MNSEKQENTTKIRLAYSLTRKIVIVTAVFSIVLSILMIANFIQTKTIEPLNSPALRQLDAAVAERARQSGA